MRKPFTFQGVEYRSATVCGIHLVKDLGKSVKEAASMLGLSYQTIYTKTKGKKARAKLEAKYHAKRLLKSKRKYTLAEIERRTGLSYLEVKNIFKVVGGKKVKHLAKKTTTKAKRGRPAKVKVAKRGRPAKKNQVKRHYNIRKHVEQLVNTAIPEIANVVPVEPVIVETAPIAVETAPVAEPIAETVPVTEAVAEPIAEVAPVAIETAPVAEPIAEISAVA